MDGFVFLCDVSGMESAAGTKIRARRMKQMFYREDRLEGSSTWDVDGTMRSQDGRLRLHQVKGRKISRRDICYAPLSASLPASESIADIPRHNPIFIVHAVGNHSIHTCGLVENCLRSDWRNGDVRIKRNSISRGNSLVLTSLLSV